MRHALSMSEFTLNVQTDRQIPVLYGTENCLAQALSELIS
jgi:hypothetical protein